MSCARSGQAEGGDQRRGNDHSFVPARLSEFLQRDVKGDGESDSNDGRGKTPSSSPSPPNCSGSERHTAHRGRGHRSHCQPECLADPASGPSISAAAAAAANRNATSRSWRSTPIEPDLYDAAATPSWLAPDITGHPAGTSTPDADSGQTLPRHSDLDRLAGTKSSARLPLTLQKASKGRLAPGSSAMTGPPRSYAADMRFVAGANSSAIESATKPDRDKVAKVTDVWR